MGGPIELDEAAWRRTIDLNVTSCFITCKHVLPHMLARRSGAIVNVSSVAAIRYTGYPYAPTSRRKGRGEQSHHRAEQPPGTQGTASGQRRHARA